MSREMKWVSSTILGLASSKLTPQENPESGSPISEFTELCLLVSRGADTRCIRKLAEEARLKSQFHSLRTPVSLETQLNDRNLKYGWQGDVKNQLDWN